MLGSKTAMICSKMVKHFLLQMASLQPDTAKALMDLVRSIGEWKAGSVTGTLGKDGKLCLVSLGFFGTHFGTGLVALKD